LKIKQTLRGENGKNEKKVKKKLKMAIFESEWTKKKVILNVLNTLKW